MSWLVILDPQFRISAFCIQIHNQRPEKTPSTEFISREVTSCILIRYIRSAVLKSSILS